MPLPAMSGADPCTGSNSDGNARSGLMLADGAMPIVPHTAGPRSDNMSPKRLDATTTSNTCGRPTKCAHRISMWYWSTPTSGYCAAIALNRSSQYGIVIEMPFDFVADVTRLRGLWRARSKANFMMRSVPLRENTDCWNTTSRSVPSHIRPPTDEYSPSVFSRTTTKSMSPGLRLASGVAIPGISRHGRMFTYWSNWRRNGISEPHSDT
jgi:hypothetical protein